MGESLDLTVTLEPSRTPPGPLELRVVGPDSLRFTGAKVPLDEGRTQAMLSSTRRLPKRIHKLILTLRWSSAGEELISPAASQSMVYVTMGRPRQDQKDRYQEDGVTVHRMDRAVSWVEPLDDQTPHGIVRALMRKFPEYSLRPSPRVPRKYHHPTYFNDEGGAWPMTDYVEETGECQAIVRVVRGILRQLGVPGEARTLLVWADPAVEGGAAPVAAYMEEGGGLDRTKLVNGRRWLATLVDKPVEVGVSYPPSHTRERDGEVSPGFNRFEACLEFTYQGVTRLYGGGAGIYRRRKQVLSTFWGLVWVSETEEGGFRIEEVVKRYGERRDEDT